MSDKENAVVTMNEYEQESFDLDALEQKLEEELENVCLVLNS